MREAAEEFDPGQLGAMTLEQREVVDLLSRGVMRYEIARRRQARTEEILDVIDSVNELLETPDSAAAAYHLLKTGMLVPAEEEIATARAKLALLSDEQKNVLQTMMSGRRYQEAGELLGIAGDEVRVMMDDIISVLHSRSPEHTVRLAYAAGLDEVPAETDDTSSQTQNEQEVPVVSRENILEFAGWMYPKQKPELDSLDDAHLAELAERIKSMAREYAAGLPTPKHKRQIRPALSYVDQWLEGDSIARIAQKAGKNDGSIRLTLTGFAERMGAKLSPDGLL